MFIRTSSADLHARSRHARAVQRCSGKDLHTQAAETCTCISICLCGGHGRVPAAHMSWCAEKDTPSEA
eukprot:6214771-Pleurochrysis_carterae.AAC.2